MSKRARKLAAAAGMVLVSTVLGATVFQQPIAGAAGSVQSFLIGNDAAHAIPVREQNLDADGNVRTHEQGTANVNVTNAAVPVLEKHTPFQVALTKTNWEGQSAAGLNVSIPTGKMLVVQTLSASAYVEAGQSVKVQVVTQGAGGLAEHVITLESQGTFGGRDLYAGSAPITAYAAGGSPANGIMATFIRSAATGDGGNVQLSVSGYLVDKP